jgi:hypothetical protein
MKDGIGSSSTEMKKIIFLEGWIVRVLSRKLKRTSSTTFAMFGTMV